MQDIAHRFSWLAAIIIVSSYPLSHARESADNIPEGTPGTEKAIVWLLADNGCAAGNKPPPGANCFGR